MHELLLHATVSAARHHQVLSILAGIAAMQPVPTNERHLIFKPLQQPAIPGRPNQNQAVGSQMKPLQGQMHGDLFYLKVVGEVTGKAKKEAREDEDKRGMEVSVEEIKPEGEGEDVDMLKASDNDSEPKNWTLQFRDLPDPSGRRPVTSRAMADIPITAGDPVKFMKAMEYSLISTSHLTGHRLTHNHIDIRLYQPLSPSLSTNPPTNPSDSTNPPTNLQPLDPSASYILQTALKVADGQNLERMQEGVRQLMELKEMLRGVVELGVVERLSLDTRVR